MNESLKRITEWAKAHPALAVGIVAVLVVVGYLVYKKIGTSGTAVTTPADTSGVTTGGGGGASTVPTDTTTPAATLETTNYFLNGTIPDAVTTVVPKSKTAPYTNPNPAVAPQNTYTDFLAYAKSEIDQNTHGTTTVPPYLPSTVVSVTKNQIGQTVAAEISGGAGFIKGTPPTPTNTVRQPAPVATVQ